MGYHFHVDFISRGKGQSLVAKGAYQAREKFREERTGEYKDYTHKPDGPVKSFVFVDKKHGAELHNVETLLNAIDRAEGRTDAQTGLNFTAALPKELSDEDRARMVRDFGREHFLRKGIPAIAHIHPPHEHAPAPGHANDNKDEHDAEELNNGNWHVHMIAGTRILGPDCQFGEKHITWDNYGAFLEHKRERWAELGGRYLENAGFKIEAERWRYGHLTNDEQREKALERGDREWAEKKAQEPGKHRGPHADAIERKGIETDLGNASREIQQRNEDRAQLSALKHDLARLERQDAFEHLKQELTAAEKVLTEARRGDHAREEIQPEPDITQLLKRDLAELDKLIYGGFTPAEMREQLAELDKSLAADLYQHQKKYPNHFRTHRQDQIPPAIAAEMEKLAAADAERDYAERDPAREQIAWEDKVAKAAIEKEEKDRQFVEPQQQPTPQQDRQQREPARTRFGDQLITRAAETAMSDTRHGEPLSSPAAFKKALETHRLALACVTPDEAAKSQRESKFAREVGNYAAAYQASEIVMVREPRNDGNTGGRVYKLDQTKAEDYLRCLAIDKSQLQGIEATKHALDDRAQTRQRSIEAAKLRKASGPRRGGLVGQQMWALERVRDADQQRWKQDRREYSEKQKRDGAEIDTERYRTDPEYRRHAQNAQAYKSPDEKKRDRENDVRAIMEQQDRGGRR